QPKKYVSEEYAYISNILQPIFKTYNPAKTSDENWTALYIQTLLMIITTAKKLIEENDPVIDISKKDISFCIHVLLQILMAIKHEPGLFSDTVHSSEWFYIVSVPVLSWLLNVNWAPPLLHDMYFSAYMVYNINLRIIHDSIKQRYNVENEVGVAEAAEENPGKVRFHSDRCKVLIETKAIVDRFILDGCHIDNVDSLQICGMEVYFI
ncbi:uncharacterized protein EV154DRAFT_397216, partial [Mucor mucedo]|uniref:uncharacterized protein n=1 Tax=Mucor mucedo TaxID=29922 RepID=UPI002220A326